MTPFHLPSDAPLRFVVVTVAWYNAWKAAELGSKAFFLLWDAWPSSFKNALALCGCHGCMAHLVAGCGLASKAAVMFFVRCVALFVPLRFVVATAARHNLREYCVIVQHLLPTLILFSGGHDSCKALDKPM